MKWRHRTGDAFIEDMASWRLAQGLLVIGSGLLVTIVHIFGRGR